MGKNEILVYGTMNVGNLDVFEMSATFNWRFER